MSIPKIEIISDRWGEYHQASPLKHIASKDRSAVKAMNEWVSTGTKPADFKHSAELFFYARHPDGRYGVLLEAELEEGFTPSSEQIEKARSCAVAPGEFIYVPPGSDVGVYHDAGAYWVFFPGKFWDIQALEQTAKNMDERLWSAPAQGDTA